MITLNWGNIDYQDASAQQLQEVEKVAAGEPDRLIFCTHPPVVTKGRGTEPDDIGAWAGSIVEVSRGGRATYHGPNQIVAYPILNLTRDRSNFGARDLRAYMHALGDGIVDALARIEIKAEYRSLSEDDGPSVTGVWVSQQKIASIGVAVRKWITYHGLALNLDHDSQAFIGINPCGFKSSVMTSVEQILGYKVNREDMHQILEETLRTRLG